MAKTYERHKAQLATGEVGETFIRGVSHALNSHGRQAHGWSVSKTYTGMSAGELHLLVTSIEEAKPRIEAKQAEKGLTWLRSRKVQKALGNRERDIVANFDHFNLVGFRAADDNGTYHLPIYMVTCESGSHFTYCTGSWQSGVPLSVVG